MSDERLGTNPLEWVTPDAAPGAAPAQAPKPIQAPPACAASGHNLTEPMTSGLFRSAENATEEPMSKGKIKIKQTMDTPQVVAYLKDLADSLESGTIRAENEDGTLVLGVADSMQVELKLARKKDKAKCEIELEWTDDGTQAGTLKISDGL
ncbi:amphi-Trp domain-containing protein [Pseudodesulfovibrio indicus]|uniref:amphi-Trp domain-containing protein n=1 Tax=Pseudodesulfovibrio indicus TaxID=1716143 RepID=UPI0029309420|nr:amphi-Trp domain-containing protein [Pseudodesulfovibrio indicus]